jgi:hypothetical protein
MRKFAAPWQQHRHPIAVTAVVVAEQSSQIALLEHDADQDVDRGDAGEQQVTRGHIRRRPERNEEAQIDRVPHEIV